jgi:hypothetical protein
MQRTSAWLTFSTVAILVPALYLLGEVHVTPAYAHGRGCSVASLKGTYAIRRTGVDNVFAGGPIAEIAIAAYDGDGTRGRIRSTRSNNGAIQDWNDEPAPHGRYTVDPDCTGSLFNKDGTHADNLIVFDGGKRYYLLSVDQGTIVTEEGTRLEAGD